jgi:type IV secretory pathway TrbL component
MNDILLYTLPQWFVFAAVFVTVYGWVEQKKTFRIIGTSIFILLGIFSFFVIFGDYLAAGKYLTPEEIANQQIYEDTEEEMPFIGQLLPAYLSFIGAAIVAIPAVLLDIRNKKIYLWFTVITALLSLLGFFIIVGVIKYL